MKASKVIESVTKTCIERKKGWKRIHKPGLILYFCS